MIFNLNGKIMVLKEEDTNISEEVKQIPEDAATEEDYIMALQDLGVEI